jgi:hypothetical protein
MLKTYLTEAAITHMTSAELEGMPDALCVMVTFLVPD